MPTEIISVEEELEEGQSIKVRISHYEPWLGGINCFNFVNGECLSKMSSGKRWQDYIDVAIACPVELEFGTKIIIEGREWVCLDRGGAIIYQDGAYWIDELTYNPTHSFGAVVDAIMFEP